MSKIYHGSISKRLGLPAHTGLTKKVCDQKVQILEKGLKQGRYKGQMLDYAVYYRSWYAWKKNNLKKRSA